MRAGLPRAFGRRGWGGHAATCVGSSQKSRLAGALVGPVLATILAGMLPARHAIRLDLDEVLKAEQLVGGAGARSQGVRFNNVGGDDFTWLGTRVLRGRAITSDDRDGSPAVVVVSQLVAREATATRWASGWPSTGLPRQVVGIAEDAPSNSLREAPEPYGASELACAPSS